MNGYRRILSHRPGTRILSSNRHRLIARLLPLVLLVAQLGAEAHAYSHVGKNPHGIPNPTQTCGICHSFAPLTMAVGTAQVTMPVILGDAEHGIPATVATAAVHSPRSSHQSRAPPALL